MKRLVVFLVLLASMLSIKAAEMYVVKSTGDILNTVTFYYDDLKSSREGEVYGIDEWHNLNSQHRYDYYINQDYDRVVFDASFKNARPTDTSFWFCGFTNLRTIENLEYLNTSEVTDMRFMFYYCTDLVSLDLSHFDTSKVTNMEYMFSDCWEIYELYTSYFNTSKVTDMSGMFGNCFKLLELDVSSFDTSNVLDMGYMFHGCTALQYFSLNNFNTSKVTNMEYMFCLCNNIEYLNLNSFNTSNVTNMESMFAGCNRIESLDLSRFDTKKVTNISRMFFDCWSLKSLDLSHFETSNVTKMEGMFSNCELLSNLKVSNFDTRNVKSMEYMFSGCESLQSLDVSNFDTGNVTVMASMFAYTGLKILDLSNFDTSNVTRVENMFECCYGLESLDISNFNLSKVRSLSHMCTDVASAEHPCLLKVPENFDYREEIDFSGDYFMWQGGYFRLPSDELRVEPVTVLKGSPSTMAIELKNPSSKKYIGYQFKIVLPEGVSICKKDNGQYSYTQGNRYGNTQMMMNIREQNDGSYMVLCFSLSNTPISGHEGAILSLDITSDGSLDDGSYEGAIRGIKFSTPEGSDVLLPDATFKVNVSKYELGDVNNDGSVSISDITLAVNYILGKASDKFHASHADMNKDGEINISDLSEMVEIILNSGNNAPKNIGVTSGLRMESAGSECSLYLPDAGLYKGCQFLVRVPSGCRLSDVSVGAGRESGHRVMYRQTGTGLYKVLVFSADGNEFEDVPSALLRLTVDGQNGGAVELSDIRFTDTDFTEHSFAAVSSEVTGIGAVTGGASESTWYSLDGQKTAQPLKGVFVRDGRKVVVK